jgi:PAS domain S-box-containing protein
MSENQADELALTRRALLQSEQRFARVFDSSPVMMTIVRASDQEFVQANQAFCQTMGYSEQEVLGKSSLDLGLWWHPPDRAKLIKSLETNGTISQTLVSFKTRSGKKVRVLWSGDVIEMDSEKCILGFAMDVSTWIQSQEALGQSEHRYKQLVETLPHGVAELDLSGRITFSNPAHNRMYGHGAGQLLGQCVYDFPAEPDERHRLKEYFKLLEATQPEPRPYFSTNLKKDGSNFDIRVDWDYNRDSSGALSGFTAVVTDVSAQNLALAALQESEERFRGLALLLPETIFEADSRGRLTFVNQSGFEYFGYEPSELDRRPGSLDMIAPHDRKRAAENMNQILEGQDLGLQEYDCLKEDGSVFPTLIHSNAIIQDGKPVGLRGFIIDMTAHKQAEEELKESEERFRATFEQAPIGIMYGGLQGEMRWANRKLYELFGYPEENLWKMKAREVTHPEDLATVELFEQLVAGDIDHYSVEKRFIRGDGSTMWAVVNASTVHSDSGEAKYFVGLIEDVTERKQVEAELSRAHDELEKRVKERTRELEDTNTALAVLLDHRDKERLDLETNIAATAGRIIAPFIERLKMSGLTHEQKTLVHIVDSALDEMVSPYAQKLSSKLYGLTPREMEVATLIRKGLMNAEVADIMAVSENAVAFHRQNIRKKLGLKRTKINLINYLQELPEK